MRLIDADAMLKRNKNSIYDTTDLEEMLHYEPTAYDVDKVVDELKKNKVNCKNSGTIFDTWDYVKLEKAIEVVKQNDWKAEKVDGEWEHYCPQCQWNEKVEE